jgi:hypothetical protein
LGGLIRLEIKKKLKKSITNSKGKWCKPQVNIKSNKKTKISNKIKNTYLISAKLDKRDEKGSSVGFQNDSWLFQSPWIWGEMRKCEEEAGEEFRVCISQKKSVKLKILIY